MIFEEQLSRKPNLYPWTEKFIEAIHGGFWTDKEFSFLSDVQDFNNRLTEDQKKMVIRALSAIGQIEIAVKTFWAKIGENLPHPAIYDLGLVMANSEVIHNKAYERLLTVLGIEDIFEENLKLEIIANRVKYLRKYTHRFYKDSKKQYIYALALFTMFVEGVSLFSQFYIIKWFGRSFDCDKDESAKFLKDTNQQVNYTLNEESHISGTEILTPKGWIDLRLISEGDEVYQYHEDGSITTAKVTRYHAYRHTGDVYSFEKTGYLCKVTPNHDIIYYNSKGEFRKRKAKDVKIHNQFFLPQGGVLKNEGGLSELSWEDRLKIAIQADATNAKYKTKKGQVLLRGKNGGYTHSIRIKKERKKERLKLILSNLNLKYIEHEDLKKKGYSTFYLYFNHNFDYKTFDWVDLSNKTSKWCKEFIDEAKNWDGSVSKNGGICYSSSKKKCIDVVQTIATLAGYLTSINVQKYEEETHMDNYRLFVRESDLIVRSHTIEKSIEKYDGMVYCVTVPSGNIITRLNDKMFIAGNCLHLNVGTKFINTIKEEYPYLFDEEMIEKIKHESLEAFKAESKIIDWMVGEFNHEYLSAEILKEFVKYRINYCLDLIGIGSVFELDKEKMDKVQWFNEFCMASSSTDFFHQKPTGYSKNNKVFDFDSLFD